MSAARLSVPSPPREHAAEFPRLDGGLNLLELDYRMAANECPELKNLWWRDGVLCSRDGQTFLTGESGAGTGWSACEQLFWDRGFFHIGDALYCGDLSDPDMAGGELELQKLAEGVPEAPGSWFRYGDKLYYKNPGSYIEIEYNREDDTFCAQAVAPYAPVVQINTEPTTAAGDLYQPENRLCGQKTVWYTARQGVTVYALPVKEVDSVDRVEVDGTELEAGSGYSADLTAGTVTFAAAPTVHDPAVANTVRITYTKGNADAYDSIMDCGYAAVYGGDRNVCVVLSGSRAQPNAYFWCGSHTAMDPGYFPMEQYNLAGGAEEAVTGFGKQQDMLVIFKEHSVGRASFGTQEMDNGRVLLEMPYTAINSRVGCDLPGTIQLIENNLVFCNTQQGVHLVRDSSAAYENNIVCISRKVNGSATGKGLLKAVREARRVTSHDDDRQYWVAADGEVYCWDYTISSSGDPSWFYLTGVNAAAFLKTPQGATCHLDGQGRVTMLRRNWQDYGAGIDKRCRFAVQHMGGYDRLKDVTRCIFTVRGDTDTEVGIEYETDYGKRTDLTPIRSCSWRLIPRNLAYRFLGVQKFATVAVRRPGCRHVRHFSMTLTNSTPGMDMAVISAAIYYKYQGRDR